MYYEDLKPEDMSGIEIKDENMVYHIDIGWE